MSTTQSQPLERSFPFTVYQLIERAFTASVVFKETSLRTMGLIFPVVRRSPAGAMTARFFTSWTATSAWTTFATGSSSTGAVRLCLDIKN